MATLKKPFGMYSADPLAAVDDRARDQLQLDAVRVEPGQGGHLSQYRQVGVRRHHHSRLDLRRDGILGQRITGIPLSWHRQAIQAEDSGHRDRHRHASILERQGGVPPIARVGSPFILDFQSAAQAIGHWVRVDWTRRAPLAEADDVFAILGIVHI